MHDIVGDGPTGDLQWFQIPERSPRAAGDQLIGRLRPAIFVIHCPNEILDVQWKVPPALARRCP
jgi:hypothetical protein